MDVSSYVSQHREALQIAQQLQTSIAEPSPSVPDIVKVLTKLTGKLKFHLSMEDKFIYPKALTSTNADLRAMAEKLQAEMTGISATIEKFAGAWNASAIARDFGKFAVEAKGVLNALKRRIDVEEKTLYPLVHKHM